MAPKKKGKKEKEVPFVITSPPAKLIISYEKTVVTGFDGKDPYVPVEDSTGTMADFIYCGPFIERPIDAPFIDTMLPISVQQSGIFSKSYAYFALKDRTPVLLTKIIDDLTKKGGADSQQVIEGISKLKHDVATNKDYESFVVDREKIEDENFLEESKNWNQWIFESTQTKYFNNSWLFSECYMYRKLKEQCLLTKGLKDFDMFEEQKNQSFTDNVEPMCVVAQALVTDMFDPEKPRDERKVDFQTLLKVCLWANKCDLSQSLGQAAPLGQTEEDKIIDPIKMITERKDKLLTDDTGKAFEQLNTKIANMRKKIENCAYNFPCLCDKLATAQGMEVQGDPAEKAAAKAKAAADAKALAALKAAAEEAGEPIPDRLPDAPSPPTCPTKMNVPACVMFDIICDNAGYELFTDLCFATYLLQNQMVDKVRFYLKNMPWYVSDATPKDFLYMVNMCQTLNYTKTLPPEPVKEGEEPKPPRTINSEAVQKLGRMWQAWVEKGTFIVFSDDFWTSPHVYRDMKKYDYWLYRRLQLATCLMFKGDLNYRKLVCDTRTNPQQKLDASLQGFNPAPMIVVRTIKTEVVCGLGKGKWDAITKLDPEWMRKGEYGVIHFCAKAEGLKPADRPCVDYGGECLGLRCPQRILYWGAERKPEKAPAPEQPAGQEAAEAKT